MPDLPCVLLRPLRPEDVDSFVTWSQDAVFCRHAGWRVDAPATRMRSFWTEMVHQPPADLVRLAAVRDGVVVGYVDLHGDQPDERELGYVVGPSASWGRGLGSLIARAGAEHGFGPLGLTHLWAEALAANEPSVRILRAMGMRETGFGDPGEFLGEATRYLRFQLRRDEWSTTHTAACGPQ